MRAALRAGAAVYNAGHYHGAHDAWEDRWLDLASGTDDERFLHGLIQFTAAVHHGRRANWEGTTGLAESALEYLGTLATDYRGMNLGDVRGFLRAAAGDPEVIERRSPPALTHEGAAVGLDDLGFEAAAIAAGILAEELDDYEEPVVERAVAHARDEREGPGHGTFLALVMDFVAEPGRRGLVYRRLEQHVERREAERSDVAGLFDAGDGEQNG